MKEAEVQRENTRLQSLVNEHTLLNTADAIECKVNAWLQLIYFQDQWGKCYRLGATSIAERRLDMFDRAINELKLDNDTQQKHGHLLLPLFREWLDVGQSQWAYLLLPSSSMSVSSHCE